MQMSPKINLVGSESIVISHFGPKVIEFLHRFLYLINGEISLSLGFHSDAPAWILVPEIWPLLAEKINALGNFSHYRFDLLRQLISPTVLRQCPKLRLIQCQNLFPEATGAADHEHASLGQALSMWLHTARQDGHPKILRYRGVLGVTQKVEELKTNFVNASSPISYVISVEFGLFHGSPFDLTNKRTRERLVLRRHMYLHVNWNRLYTFWMLTRGPNERDEKQWAEWELEAADPFLWQTKKNAIFLHNKYGDKFRRRRELFSQL
uniref:Uncharacterized protein n=1 Tax=Globodera rostochiensis TaxID=31243 RepID=A0A914HFE3_GLORO